MAVNLVRKSSNSSDEERRKQLLAQIQEQSQARKNADIQAVQNMKLNWVDPNINLGTGIGWLGRTAGNQAKKSVLDTLTALPQSYSVGLQRGANQAGQEKNTWDKVKNFGKNYLKSIAVDPVSRLLYNTTIGRNDYNDKINQIATQTAVNTSQADSTWKKATGYIGALTSFAGQEIADYGLVGQLYTSGQQAGQVLGEENATNVSNKIREFDDKIHEKNEKRAEELQREGSLYKGSSNKALNVVGNLEGTAQTIGYMTPSIAINLVTGGASSTGQAIGLAQMGLASKSNTTRESVKQGLDYETAERRGIVSGEVEAGTELMWNGLDQFKALKQNGLEGTIKNWISDTVEKKFTNELIQKGLKTAGNWLVDVSGESIEELTSDIYDTWLERATLDPNKQYTINDAINTVVQTIASTTYMNVGQAGIGRIKNKVSEIKQNNAKRKGQVTEVEQTASNGYKENLQEMINNLDVPDEVKAQIQPMLDSSDIIDTEQYKYITNELKTLVKANTQQQIADYGAELTTQYNAIEEQRQSLDNIKPENFKDQESRRFYAQQMNKEFSDNTLDTILATYPENRNGNRTVKQYKEIAKAYGQQMALNGLTFDEVRANTVGAWQYYEPNKNITRYDNKEHKNQSFDRLNSQVWSQEVYDSYRDTMKTQLDQQQKELADTANARLEEIQDKENITLMTIDDLKPKASPEQVARTKKLIEDFAKARGVNVEYNAEVFKNNNEEGFIKDKGNGERTIYINPNADTDTILVKLATHEMFHDTIRTQPHDKLTQLVMDRLKADENYDMYRQSVVDAYLDELNKLENTNKEALTIDELTDKQNALIDEEMTAKYLGEYLGDEQFVQQLVNSTNRTTIQKIMDWIDNRLQQIKNVVTGNKEAEYWRKVRENFEKAYNSKYQGQEGTQYSKELENQESLFNMPTEDTKKSETIKAYEDFIDRYNQQFEKAKEIIQQQIPNLKMSNIINQKNSTSGSRIQITTPDGKKVFLYYEGGGEFVIGNGEKRALTNQKKGMIGGLEEVIDYIKSDILNENTRYSKKTSFDEALQQDNKGRELSEEQKKYFKDSKVRDRDGNLITLYHGTDNEVTTFDTNKPTYARYGSGAYLTDGIGIASDFADIRAESNNGKARIIEGYANIDKMFDNTTGLTENTPERQKLFELLKERGLSDRQLSNIESAEIDYPFQLMERYLVKDEVTNDPWIKANTVNKLLREAGYNGIKGYYGDGSYEYVTFNSNQIKDIENKKPTTNDDIRYSKKTKFDEALQQDNQKTNKPIKENRQYLEKQFEELTGDSILRADAKLAGREVRNKQRQAGNLEGEMEALPYNEEAMNLYKKIKSSVKSSNYLYHSTPADRLQSIIENGLTIGNKQNQEGVSSKDKLYLSASEELANSFTPDDSITFRINPNAKLENLDSDLLGGEGAYTITNNIPPEMLQVKENGKWVRLDKSELAKTNSTQIKATDNQGRTLTKEQQEYFKDSKVRDENGNLITVYHGTPNGGFTIFDRNKIKNTATTHQWGYGFYFSNNSNVGDEYTRNYNNTTGKYSISKNPQKYTAYLDIKNPFIISDTISGEEGHSFDRNKLKELILKGDDEWFYDNWIPFSTKTSNELNYKLDGLTEDQIKSLSKEEKVDYWLRQEYDERGNKNILQEMKRAYSNVQDLMDNFKKILGYDGIIVNGRNGTNQYIVFNSNQIKNVDNLNPTEDPDIRYSKKTKFDEALQKDNQGNTINPGMQEYLKDVSSEELVKGKVPLVYHTTTGYGNQFTEFNPVGTEGYKFGQQVVNYFTDSEDMSKSYADGVKVEKANTKRINTIEEARELVKDKYNISKTEDGKYKVSNDEIKRVLDQFNKEYYSKWSLEEKEVFKKTLEKNRTDVYENILKPPTDKLNEYSIYEKVHQQYLNFLSDDTTNQNKIGILPTSIPTLVKQYINNENIDTTIKTYDSEKQLLKDLPNLISGYAKRQYSGYVKLTNPYVIEGKGNLWKFVEKIDDSTKEKQSKVYDSLSEKEKQDLIHIALNTESGYYGFDNQIDKRADIFMNALENVWKNGKGLAKKLKPIWTTQDKGHIYNYIKTGFDEMQVPREYSYSTNELVYKVLDMNKNGSNYDGLIIKDIVDYGSNYASDYNKPANVYVTFNSNQFKAQDNMNPTEDPDIRYNIKSKAYDDYLKANNPNRSGVTIGDLQQRLPTKQPKTTQPKLPTAKKTQLPTTNVQPTTENLEIPNEQTSIPLGEQVNPSTQKQRKTYKSIIESPVMSEEAKKIARKFIGQDTYTPDSNLKQLERADNIISRLGTEKALNQLESNAMEGRTIKAEDIATGDRLIEYYSKIGDSENLQRAIRATAMAGTQAGRSVQAFALLKHQTPQGMAVWIQNSVDKLNSQTKNGQFDFTTEMQEKILNSTEDNLQENVDEVMKELGQQVPQSLLGKLDTWRYFSMLANPKTHIRNIVGNFAMGLTQQVKSKVAGTIEQVTGQDRTHTSLFEKRSRANIDFAKNDLKNVSAQLGTGESKYSNPKNQIQQNQRVFKSDALEKSLGRMFKMNDKLLEAEDSFGLKNAYVRNLSDYMTANKLNPNTITNEQLQQARKVAIEEALRATFHQESSLASMLNQIEKKNLASRILMGGLVPFKKTPINVAKSGFEYSPAGLAKAIVYDSVQLRKGNINVNEYIDNISKGLTGTGIALVGYALAEAGILKAGGDDDKDEKYRQAMGEQEYSINNKPLKELLKKAGINIPDSSYSLDWLAPTGIPLFVGAELNKLVHDKTEKDGETQNEVLKAMGRIADATTSLLNPMSEMSMISGLTSTIQSFSSDPGQALMNLVVSPVKSYVGQAVPTALGQVARTTDKYERDTSSTETGLLPKAIDQTKNQIMNKIPGLRQMLPTKKDVWGEEVETQDYFHNAVLPYTEKEIKTNAVDKELNDLYERTGESIYPNTSLSKTVTYEGSKTRLTNQDYNDFKTNYGKTSYKLLEDLTKSKEYKGMSDEQKVKAIKDVYTYANNLNKTEYAEKKGIEFKTPTDVQQVRAVKAYGGKESDYFKYKGITDGLSKDSEKLTALKDSNLSSKSKRAVYSATLGKDDTLFQSTNIDVNEYLGYKTANIQGTKDSSGKTISGTKKTAQLDYINNNISGYENRLLLMGKDYKLSRSQQQDLSAYIDTLDNAEELYTMFDKNFTVKSSSSLGQYGKGNIDLYNRPIVTNSDGSISTVRSMSFEENGKEILIPTVVNGRVVSDDEAIDHYHRTGEYLGKFNSVKEADDYAEKLHEDQEKMYSSGGRTTGYTVYYK